jgi:O-antigen/teichoic acid export membrane protein
VTANAALLLAARVVSALATLAVLVLVGRYRGAEALGLVGVGLAIGGIVGTLTDAGTSSLLVREASRDQALTGRLLVAFASWRLVVVPLALAGVWALLPLAYPGRPVAILLAAATLALQYFSELTRAPFLARQWMLPSSLHSIAENLGWLAVVTVSLAAGGPLEVALLAGVALVAAFIVAGLALDVVLLGVAPALPTIADVSRLARDAAPFAAFAVLLAMTAGRIDTVLVSSLVPASGLVAAGAYFTATRLVGAFEYLPEAVSRALYPALARAFISERTRIGELLRPAAAFLLFLGTPVPFAMFIAGALPITVLLGPSYAPYGWLIVGLAIVVPFRYLAYLFGVALTGSDAQGRRVLAVGAALAVTVLVDVALLPLIGVAGAIVGALTGSLVALAAYVRDIRQRFGAIGLFRPLAEALGCSIAATAGALGIRAVAGELAALAAFGAIYAVLVAMLRAGRRRSWNRTRLDSATRLSSTSSKSDPNAARKPSSE